MSGTGAPIGSWLSTDLPVWTGEDDDRLICRRVVQETHDVRSFFFSAPAPARFAFMPGQFLTFGFSIGGETVHRCYTISSPPTRPLLLSITVKKVAGGPVSNWLHDTLRPGMAVRAVGPMGAFSSAFHPAGKYLFLSGGSGITPSMSMVRCALDLGDAADSVFVHSARSPADIVFRDELALIGRHLPQFRAVFVCEADSASERWGGYRGRLSAEMLRLIAPDAAEREVFTCGPAPYMAEVSAMLQTLGCDLARHHQESFVFADLPEEQQAEAASEAGAFRVEFTKSARVIEVAPDAFVLGAARGAGLRLPASCTKGMCGTCKSRLISGKVDMRHQGGIRQREIDQGLVLLCCSRPLSDLVIER